MSKNVFLIFQSSIHQSLEKEWAPGQTYMILVSPLQNLHDNLLTYVDCSINLLLVQVGKLVCLAVGLWIENALYLVHYGRGSNEEKVVLSNAKVAAFSGHPRSIMQTKFPTAGRFTLVGTLDGFVHAFSDCQVFPIPPFTAVVCYSDSFMTTLWICNSFMAVAMLLLKNSTFFDCYKQENHCNLTVQSYSSWCWRLLCCWIFRYGLVWWEDWRLNMP